MSDAKPRIRVPATAKVGEVIEIKTLVQHVMETGNRKTADGKVVPPEGTREAFQKYLELKPTGPFADSAKGMLSTLEGAVQTQYVNPDAQKAGAKKKSTKK